MRKTNCKETRRAVEAYVMEEVQDVLERCEAYDVLRPVDTAYRIIKEEMAYQTTMFDGRSLIGAELANKYRASGHYTGYIAANTPYFAWLLAVDAGEFEAYYADVRDDLKNWLDETEEEAAKYDDGDVWRLYAILTASAFQRLHEKENTPRKVNTGEFIRLYNRLNGGNYFDRETLAHWGQTRKSFTVTAFYLVEDARGIVHDCYKVESIANSGGYEYAHAHYFDRITLAQVFPKSNEEA